MLIKRQQRVLDFIKDLKPGQELAIRVFGVQKGSSIVVYTPPRHLIRSGDYDPLPMDCGFTHNIINDMLIGEVLEWRGEPQFSSGCWYVHLKINPEWNK